MNNKLLLLMGFALLNVAGKAQNVIDLSGTWQFGKTDRYGETIQLPGSMLTNGKGNDVTLKTRWVGSIYDSSFYFNPYMEKYRVEGNIKFPFFLTPKKHYVGEAWYGKEVFVPKSWKKRSVVLFLERPHITTTVRINGVVAGRDSSLSVPHEFDITRYVKFGKQNKIDILIDNRVENVCVGQDSHSVTDQTQGDWNGIIGRMELQSRPRKYIRNVMIFPDVKNHCAHIKLCLDKDTLERTMKIEGKMRLWDEFDPYLYEYVATYGGDTVRTKFGMREITIKGRQFYMNDKPIWIRGTVGNCCFPQTGYPPTDEKAWEDIFRKCKANGINMMRFHSYCPPEAAFNAADKLGFYLQPEGPSWPNHGVKLRRGMTIDRYLMEETQRMVDKYGNHPSFCMLAAGNEPAGDWVSWVGDFVDYWKGKDSRRVYCGASVGGGWAFDPKSQYHVKGGARGLDWDSHAPQSQDDYYGKITKFLQKGSKPITFEINEPYLSHEQGQWCAFPDFKEISQYTGVYKAGNFEIFRDMFVDNVSPTGKWDEKSKALAERFLHASGKLQTLAYKYEIERNLRTKDYAGFQLLGLNDYTGQGTALVGVLNAFWKDKGYADDWSKFCAPMVPLAKFPKFVYSNDEAFEVPVELYNAWRAMHDVNGRYTIIDGDGNKYAEGATCDYINADLGKNIDFGKVKFALNNITEPKKLTLKVGVACKQGESLDIENEWDFWVYPSKVEMTSEKGIYIADSLDARAIKVLQNGGKVLITAAGKVKLGDDVKQTYLPVFWNTSWFKMRPPHTTGATIDTKHPLFRNFPTDDWANLNWWELINKAQVMNLMELPREYESPVQPIDTWHVSRKLGMIVEANVLKGKLLITTMDISSDLSRRLVARQMRNAIISYMQSKDFCPPITLDTQVVADMFTKKAPVVNMYTNDSPDELKPKLK
ncbi:MAG: beta-glucuronidase [Prevotella sp.]|nr:beta-glucuronidase [Prevotella sp.]